MSDKTPNLINPDWEPTDKQWDDIAKDFGYLVRWRASMADQGTKVLDLDLSPEEELRRAREWAKSQEELVD